MPGFHHSVAVLPLPFRRSAISVSKSLPFPYTVAVAAAVAYLFAVYGCNGTEFSYVIFFQNSGILQRQNGETATEERQRNGGNRALLKWVLLVDCIVWRHPVYATSVPSAFVSSITCTVTVWALYWSTRASTAAREIQSSIRLDSSVIAGSRQPSTPFSYMLKVYVTWAF